MKFTVHFSVHIYVGLSIHYLTDSVLGFSSTSIYLTDVNDGSGLWTSRVGGIVSLTIHTNVVPWAYAFIFSCLKKITIVKNFKNQLEEISIKENSIFYSVFTNFS